MSDRARAGALWATVAPIVMANGYTCLDPPFCRDCAPAVEAIAAALAAARAEEREACLRKLVAPVFSASESAAYRAGYRDALSDARAAIRARGTPPEGAGG